MNNERTYTYYRNRRVPGWWIDYLPEEKNPYKASDTLTLQKGCLSDYWYIHSSNKHPNYRGVEACNFVHSLIRERFGGVFLSNDYDYHRLGRSAGTLKTYHEPEHLVYANAYIGEDGVYSDRIEHSARRFRADLPPVQCTLSGKQSTTVICLIMKGCISKTVSMGHLCRRRPCH